MLKELRVQNLGPIEEATILGDKPVTLILGPNESGKTTLLEALSVLYFGTRGNVPVSGNAALTRSGSKGWKVEAVLDDGEILTATRSQRPTRETLAKHLGDPRVFKALCQVEAFLDLSPFDRKQLIADLAASDTLALADELEADGIDGIIVKAVRHGNLRRAHGLATDMRRAIDRTINGLKALAEEDVEDTEVQTKKGSLKISTVPLETVEEGIARLTKRRDEIRSAAYDLEAWERINRDAKEAQAELDDLKATASWDGGDDGRLRELETTTHRLRRDNAQAQAEIRAASELDQKLAELAKTGGDCPTCLAPLKNKAAQEALKKARGECANTINQGQALCKENAAKLEADEEEIQTLRSRKAQYEQAQTYRSRLERKVAELSTAEKPEVPKGDVEKLVAEIQRLQGMRDARRAYDVRVHDRERARKVVASKTPERDRFVALEKRLDPSAIGDEESVLTEINGHLANTCGKLGVPVVLNDGYELSIHGRAPGLASDSARLRAGFGVACALSILGGVGLAFLDRFEALDDQNRKRVLGLLKGLTEDGLLSLVLIGVVKQNPVKVGNVPWLASMTIEDGTASYLEA